MVKYTSTVLTLLSGFSQGTSIYTVTSRIVWKSSLIFSIASPYISVTRINKRSLKLVV